MPLMMPCYNTQWRPANRPVNLTSPPGMLTACFTVHFSYMYPMCRSLAEIVQGLAGSIVPDKFSMVVRRSQLLEDALKRAASTHFSPFKAIEVVIIANLF